jgi:hypothetical protein
MEDWRPRDEEKMHAAKSGAKPVESGTGKYRKVAPPGAMKTRSTSVIILSFQRRRHEDPPSAPSPSPGSDPK